jgi:hypothetical protein
VIRCFKKKITPKELLEKQGSLLYSSESTLDLILGAERQWKRYNDPVFQEKEFYKKYNKLNGLEYEK